MRKAPEAFRTISEAADALDTPAHVLRFWESKFTQVKPVKRAGGRRYYRPADIDLLAGIKVLLHDHGMTIRGVQKLLQEKGAKHVAAMAPLSGDLVDVAAVPMLRVVSDTPPDAPPALTAPPAPEAAPDRPERAAPLPQAKTPGHDLAAATPDKPSGPESDTDSASKPAADAAPPADTSAPQLPPIEPEPELPAPPPEVKTTADPKTTADRPAPALAALLEAAAADLPAPRPRFAKIAHALRLDPPQDLHRFAPALAKLESLVAKLSARAD